MPYAPDDDLKKTLRILCVIFGVNTLVLAAAVILLAVMVL